MALRKKASRLSLHIMWCGVIQAAVGHVVTYIFIKFWVSCFVGIAFCSVDPVIFYITS